MWSRVTLCKYLRYQVFTTGSNFNYLSTSWFPLSRIFYVRTCVKLTFKNNIEAKYERSHVSVKVEPRSTSRLISTLYFLPLFYLRALTCGAKNASVEIHPNVTYVSRMCLYGLLSTWLSAALHVHRIEIPYRAFPERVGPRIRLSLESFDYFGTSDYFSGRIVDRGSVKNRIVVMWAADCR